MKKDDVLKILTQDAAENCGEIIETTTSHIRYYDYNTSAEINYRFEESLSDDNVKQLIHMGEHAKTQGLTIEHLIKVLKKAFGDDYYDALCTLSGIIIPSNEAEFDEMLEKANSTNDEMREWYEWSNEENFVGHLFSHHQIVLVNAYAIAKIAHDIAEDIPTYKKEYQIGILTTLIHEIRHLMLETNDFLPEDEFPDSEREENAVENFCRTQYENLGELQFWQ